MHIHDLKTKYLYALNMEFSLFVLNLCKSIILTEVLIFAFVLYYVSHGIALQVLFCF